MNETNFKNYFLIAMPSMEDSNFTHAVIFLCDHNEEGAMGLIINKPLNVKLSSVLEHLEIKITNSAASAAPIYMGGPVGQEHGFVIYSPYQEDEDNDDIIISASKETLTDIAQGNGPDKFLITLGYTGWNAGQLEKEINDNDWLVVPYNKDVIFDTPTNLRWKKAVELLGIDIKQISSLVGHA